MGADSIAPDNAVQEVDPATLRRGLQLVRRRRWCFWSIILVYMPLMGVAMKFHLVAPAFLFWFVLLFGIVYYTALARCPRCGNYFHLHGMSLMILRKCLHCQLHICADKRR